MALNIMFRESLDSRLLLKDFFIFDCEGRKDGRFNMDNTIDYISAYMPFKMHWSIRVSFEDFLKHVWTTEGDKGPFTRNLLTKYCGLDEADKDNDTVVKKKLIEELGVQ